MRMSSVGTKDVGDFVVDVDSHPVATFSKRVGSSEDETVAKLIGLELVQVFGRNYSEEEWLSDLTATENSLQFVIIHSLK